MAMAILDHTATSGDASGRRPASGQPKAAPPAAFHPVPIDPGCPHCRGGASAERLAVTAADWSFADAVYCISLEERDDRMARAAAEFHRIGLCRRVLFHRPSRHRSRVIEGIWDAHRAVARHALDRSSLYRSVERVLILEDDVRFTRRITSTRLAKVRAAIDRLPADWTIFFLGHWPLRARFRAPDTLETKSACAHAYLASPRLLRWLDAHPFGQHTTQLDKRAGAGIDAAYARLDGTFAYFPMLAIQGILGSDHMAEKIRTRPIKKLKHLVTRTDLGEVLLSRLMRPNEFLIAGIGAIAGAAERVGRRRPTA
jgi:hypothetical protein